METTNRDKFEDMWKDFTSALHGRLIRIINKQKLSNALANLNLAEVATTWESSCEVNGRWLMELRKTDEERAQLVLDIIREMKFAEIEDKKPMSQAFDFILPLSGAAVGFACSWYFEASKIIQAVATILPAVAILPAVKTVRKQQIDAISTETVNQYMGQLGKFHDSIASVLES